MAPFKHFDEARREAIAAMKGLLQTNAALERAVLIQDLFGKVRVVAWTTSSADATQVTEAISSVMQEAAAAFWTQTVWVASSDTCESDRIVYDGAWDEGTALTERLRLDDRHRNRTAWFAQVRKPIWATRGHLGTEAQGPPVVVFASFKGGVGRTTALAAFAIQRARSGERVVVVDFDLDAPGVGTLLAADDKGTISPWGVVDYLLERPLEAVPLDDYTHRCARESVTGDGEIIVVPAGLVNDDYLTKLSRVDLEILGSGQGHPLAALLEQVRAELNPAWVLMDSRAGLSPAAGLLLSGFAHLHVVFGTTSEQSFRGIERLVHHLGADRPRDDPQADCLIVQAMVPDNSISGANAMESFRLRIEAIFTEHYLLPDDADPDDRFWSVRDLDNSSAPHVPIPIPYRERFAFFESIEQVADDLATGEPYQQLNERIQACFPARNEDKEED